MIINGDSLGIKVLIIFKYPARDYAEESGFPRAARAYNGEDFRAFRGERDGFEYANGIRLVEEGNEREGKRDVWVTSVGEICDREFVSGFGVV